MLAVAVVIVYGSLVTVRETVVDDVHFDLVALHHWRHQVAYFALACSVASATDHWERSRWVPALVVIAIATGYGLGLEKSFVPHRSDVVLSDVVVNALGAAASCAGSPCGPDSRCGHCLGARREREW